MATKVKSGREAGTRIVAFLLDNEQEWEAPKDAHIVADGMLDLDNPDTNDNGTAKLFYQPVADPNNPLVIDVVVDNKRLECAVGGQVLVYLTSKAIAKAKSKAARS